MVTPKCKVQNSVFANKKLIINLRSPVFVKYGPTKYKLDEELHQLFEKFYLPSLVLELGGLGYFTLGY